MSEEKVLSFTTEEYVQISGDEFVIKFAGKLNPDTQKRLNERLKDLINEEFPRLNPDRIQFPIRGWVGMIVSPSRDIDFKIPSQLNIKFRLR